jgi:hypothetical protein
MTNRLPYSDGNSTLNMIFSISILMSTVKPRCRYCDVVLFEDCPHRITCPKYNKDRAKMYAMFGKNEYFVPDAPSEWPCNLSIPEEPSQPPQFRAKKPNPRKVIKLCPSCMSPTKQRQVCTCKAELCPKCMNKHKETCT